MHGIGHTIGTPSSKKLDFRKSWYNCLRLLWNKKQPSLLHSAWSISENVTHIREVERPLADIQGLRKIRIVPEQSRLSIWALNRSKDCIEDQNQMAIPKYPTCAHPIGQLLPITKFFPKFTYHDVLFLMVKTASHSLFAF